MKSYLKKVLIGYTLVGFTTLHHADSRNRRFLEYYIIKLIIAMPTKPRLTVSPKSVV